MRAERAVRFVLPIPLPPGRAEWRENLLLRACAAVMAELKPQLRALLNYHCGVGTLRTRQMMIDLQSL